MCALRLSINGIATYFTCFTFPDRLGKPLTELTAQEHEQYLESAIQDSEAHRKKTDIVTLQRQTREQITVPLVGDDLVSAHTPQRVWI